MRRLGRWTLNTLTVLSVGMCVGTVGLWVRGRHGRAIDFVDARLASARRVDLLLLNLSSGDGVLVVGWTRDRYESPVPPGYTGPGWVAMFPMPKTGSIWQQSRYQACDGGVSFGGVRVRRYAPRTYPATPGIPGYTSYGWIAGIPYGWLVATFGILPGLRAARRMRNGRRRVPGQCIRCGYDLRATPDRCPECGTAVKEAAA